MWLAEFERFANWLVTNVGAISGATRNYAQYRSMRLVFQNTINWTLPMATWLIHLQIMGCGVVLCFGASISLPEGNRSEFRKIEM